MGRARESEGGGKPSTLHLRPSTCREDFSHECDYIEANQHKQVTRQQYTSHQTPVTRKNARVSKRKVNRTLSPVSGVR